MSGTLKGFQAEFNQAGKVVCNGVVCGFAQEVREELSMLHSATKNVRERMTSFEGHLSRISSMVTTTHTDTVDIRRMLRVLHGSDADMRPAQNDILEIPEVESFDREETDRWLGKTKCY